MTTSPTPPAASICLNCGQLANIVHPGNKCPHCEQNAQAPIDPRAIDPATLTVALDLSCTKCSYNIKTLHVDSRCPECGTPICQSIQSKALRFASLDWLTTVRAGVSMLFAVAVIISVFVLMPATAALTGINFGSLALMMLIVTGILLLMGVIGVAAMEDEDNMTRRERLPHHLSMAALLAFFIPFMLIPAAMNDSETPALVLFLLLLGSLTACYLSVAICLTRLAKRDSRHTLARNTAGTFWIMGLVVLLAFIGAVADGIGLNVPLQIVSIFFVTIGLVFAISYIAAIVILVQHRRMLTKAIRSREAMDDAIQPDHDIDDHADTNATEHTEPNLAQD